MDNALPASTKPAAFFSRLYVRLVMLILFVLLPALILALLMTGEQNRILTDAARQQALTLAQLTATNQRELVSGTERVLITLSQIPQVRNGDTTACNALFVQLRERYESYTNFFMVNIQGDTVCTGLPAAPPVNVKELEWFKRAETVEGFSVSNYSLGAVTKRPIITLSYPIYDSGGKKLYYLGASLDLEWMNRFILSTELPSDTSVSALDRNGIVLYRYPDGEQWIGQEHSNTVLVRTIIEQQIGITQALGIDQVERLYAFVPLDDNASAFVLVGLSQEVVFGQSRALLFQSLGILGIVGLMTLVFAVTGVEGLLVRPIRTLARATVKLAEGDLAARIDMSQVEDTQELGELGRSFNAMAAALEQAREGLETKVRERTQELSLLAEASSLLTSSLDYEATLTAVAQLAVPQIADWCAIDLIDPQGVLRRLAIAHLDPEKVKFAQALHERYPPNPRASSGLYHILRTREMSLISHVSEDLLRQFAENEEHLDLLRQVGMVSAMSIPLIARGRVLGVISLASSNPERPYGQDDLKLAGELARRAATTIDNAYLYHELYRQQKQLQVTLSSIGDAVIATDLQGKIIFINPVAQQVTGWPEDEAIGQPLSDVFRIVGETSRERIENPFDKVVREGKIVGLANHTLLISRDGRQIPIDDSGAPIFDDVQTLVGVILVFRDISERRRSEQRLNLLFELSTAFSRALTSREIAEIVIERGVKALDALVGTVCLLVEDGAMLEIINRYGLSPESFEEYRHTPLEFSGPLNDAVRGDHVVWIETLEEYIQRYPHFKEAILRNGSQSTICIPLKVNDKKIGGFSLSFEMEKRRNPDEEAFLVALAQQCAQSLERARLYEAEQMARSLSDQNLQRVARLQSATAALSEALTVSQVAEVTLTHTMRATSASAGLLARLTDNGAALDVIGTQGYVSDTLSTRDYIPLEEIPSSLRERFSTRIPLWIETDEIMFQHLRQELPPAYSQKIWAILPLNSQAQDHELGLLILTVSPEHDTPDESQTNFLVTLTQQCAQALERAQLYEQARDVAAAQERQRLARDLHDAVSQVLFSSTSIAESVPRIWERSPQRAFEHMNTVVTLNRAAMAEMRSLLLELRPETILRTNLSHLIEQLLRAVKGRKSIETDFVIEGEEYFLPPEIHVAFYRIAQETINNIVKHSQAARITIQLSMTPASASVIIEDNGQGFETDISHAGMGLQTMRERAVANGMRFELHSRVGQGTQVTLVWDQPL